MTPADFKNSVAGGKPPADLTPPLEGLWWAAKGDWDKAHKIVQDVETADAAWVHAYLHRVEGDLPNARYWYGQARREPASSALETEWADIAAALLVNNHA
ncbi:MAG TPA: hypothetical protein VJL90_12185 [Pseudorhodoplanes sp.]|nr:hypothetical protein [Pseudorhodoplanes sp.]